MSGDSPFADFVQRIRAGDGSAAEELVRLYEPLIRREVRLSLEDRRLSRLLDSMDICQSVLKSFFARTAAGQYDLEDPAQLAHLLLTMARNKSASEARRQRRWKRDHRRIAGGGDELASVPADQPSPSQIVSNKELWDEVRGRLTDEERAIADCRGQGFGWEEIAVRLGGKAQARRVQLRRALDRVAEEFQRDEAGDE